MTYYLLPTFNSTLIYNNESFHLSSGDIYFFNLTGDTTFNIIADNTNDSINYSFSIKSDTPSSENIKVIKLSNNALLIQLLPIDILNINNIQSQIYMYENSPCIINLFNSSKILIQYKKIKIFKKLIGNNYEINICEKNIKNNKILFLSLKSDNKSYYLILNNEKILFNNYLKEINLNDNLIILDDNINSLGEKTVFDFDLEKNTTKKYAVKYQSKQYPKDIEILFLDAIKVSNQKLMRSCLTKKLEETTIENMQEFLGEFDDYLKIEEHFVLLNDGVITTSMQFEIKDNLICNINI